ncbi:MAG: cysteine desulfurase-like protein [Gemmataceae bacterium]|nr:cysteine desulfurase-like protein [Gemmataceae bacterium]
MGLLLDQIRNHFPALQGKYAKEIHADAPGGTQVPLQVANAITQYLFHSNANLGAPFRSSLESSDLFSQAGKTVQAFLNASKENEIAFGQNMTTLTFHLARSFTKTLSPQDLVVSTQMDHEANIAPWQFAARDAGCQFALVKINLETCQLEERDFQDLLRKKPKLVAFSAASNASGIVNPVKKLARWAHDAGSLVYVDAVHYAPHRLIDVQDWDCDFLACSAYKFFGPHVGILYGKEELLNSLPCYKVRPAPETLPGKWMTGTQNHEGIAGTVAAINYLASLGKTTEESFSSLRDQLSRTYELIGKHEAELCRVFLERIGKNPSLKILGNPDPENLANQVATFSLVSESCPPHAMAERLAQKGIFTYAGNFYAKTFMECLGREEQGGVLRLGFAHYNTLNEVEIIAKELEKMGS